MSITQNSTALPLAKKLWREIEVKRGENESEMPGLPTGVKFQRAANSGQQVGMPLRISMHICMHVNDTHMHSFIHIYMYLRTYVYMYNNIYALYFERLCT